MANTLRLFVAVELTDPVRRHIANLMDTLRGEGVQGFRWLNVEGIHLTLKFLGTVPEGSVDEIVEGMEEAVEGVSPFSLSIENLGAFPDLGSPRVLWVGVHGELDPLLLLQSRLEEALVARGFAKETRAFSPHLTLARTRGRFTPTARKHLTTAVESALAAVNQELPVGLLSLMESNLTSHGAIYTRRSQISLRSSLAL